MDETCIVAKVTRVETPLTVEVTGIEVLSVTAVTYWNGPTLIVAVGALAIGAAGVAVNTIPNAVFR